MYKISYALLNAKQKENYNFAKIAAVLADYGYTCLWLNDDWQGADFLACHIDGDDYLKVQLKGRLLFAKKYIGKEIHIAFKGDRGWYLYPHDDVLEFTLGEGKLTGTKSWDEGGEYSWPGIPDFMAGRLSEFLISESQEVDE